MTNIDDKGNIVPEETDKTIVIDADTVAYAACTMCQYEVENIGENGTYDDVEDCYMDIDIEDAINHSLSKIETILTRIGGKKENTELHFTSGKNFRYKLLEEAFPDSPHMWYKASRRKRKATPAGLHKVKEELGKYYNSFYHSYFEADDFVVMRKNMLKDKCILCSIDKDVYKNTEDYGQPHWNYFEAGWLNHPIEMRWVEVSKEEAQYNQYIQAIMGDKSDNVPGLKGIGPKKAAKFIEYGMSEYDMWLGLENAYIKHCKYTTDKRDATAMAILNMRLVNVNQLKEGELVLWEPPKDGLQ